MKRLVAVILMLTLSLTLVSSGFAIEAQYANTKEFAKVLDDNNIKYTISGMNSENYEMMEVPNSGDSFDYTIRYFFCDDNELVSIRVWYIIEYNDADFAKLLRAVNDLNNTYKYVKFYVDESDNSVSADMDLIVREGNSVGDITLEGTLWLVKLLDSAYEVLSVYGK